MGMGRWSSTDWDSYSTAKVAGKPTAAVFATGGMKPEFDPKRIAFRESRDSADNPSATPVWLVADVTQSMQIILERLMRGGLNGLATALLDTKPVSDPHIGIMAVGDAQFDTAPLQVTEMEADISVCDQVADLWLEKGGGYTFGESYALAYLFAAKKFKSYAWERRRKRGYLVSVGDEPPKDITVKQARDFLGIDIAKTMTTAECAAAADQLEIFHVVLTSEGHCKVDRDNVILAWEAALPGRVILLDDLDRLSDTVVAAIRIAEGASKASSTAGMAPGTAVSVASAIGSLTERGRPSRGVSRLD